MKRTALLMVVAVAATITLSGCKNPDDEFAPAIAPKAFVFEGQVDAKYAGTWGTADGSSTIDVVKDGSLKIESVTHSQAGKNVSHVSGKWLASGNSLLFQYTVGSQPPTVLKYSAAISGNTLTLVLDGGNHKTVYKRK